MQMRNLIVALAGFAAHTVIAQEQTVMQFGIGHDFDDQGDWCGSQPARPEDPCLTVDAYYYMDQNAQCNDTWMAWDYWCGCVGYDDTYCAAVDADMVSVFSETQWNMLQSAREQVKKLGGADKCVKGCKKGMKPATFKKLMYARLVKEKEQEQVALLSAAQEMETPQVEEGSEY